MTVLHKQCLLTVLGYDVGGLDGIDGPKTQAALNRFIAEYGVGEDGLKGAVGGTVPKLKTVNDIPSVQVTNSNDDFWAEIKHFKREEFRCPCGRCGGFPVEPYKPLVRFLDRLRDTVWANRSVTIIPLSGDPHAGGSGIRCRDYNSTLSGSAANSYHLTGHAADIIVSGLTSGAVKSYLDQFVGKELHYVYCCGTYSTHLDMD